MSAAEMVVDGPKSAWRTIAAHRARQILQEVKTIDQTGLTDQEKLEREVAVDNANEALRVIVLSHARSTRGHVQNWVSGNAIETCWGLLHEAEDALVMCLQGERLHARLPGIQAALRSALNAKDPRLEQYTKRLDDLRAGAVGGLDLAARSEIREIQRTANAASIAAHANVRSFRNLLAAVAPVLILLLIAVAVLHALAPGFIDLSAGAKQGQDAAEVWQVMVVGALGGLLGAVLTVVRLGGFSGPYRLPAYQALMRVPMGAATATAGAMLLQSSLINALNPQQPLALLGYCLLFGYAPDLFLRYLDQRLAETLGKAQDKNNPAPRPDSLATARTVPGQKQPTA